jgi:DNA repair exonuclease SbcCD ATPase subunit
VLFRGNTVIARGSAADEEQAKKARVPFTGDLLWFQLDGKTYVTQDKDVLDRIQASGTGTDSRFTAAAEDLAQAQRRLAEAELRRKLAEAQSQSQLADQNRALQELQSSLERINRNLANSTGPNRNPQQTELEGIRSEVSRLQALSAQMQAITAQSEAELRARQSELEAMRGRNELSAVREAEILRGAVREGKAQPVP